MKTNKLALTTILWSSLIAGTAFSIERATEFKTYSKEYLETCEEREASVIENMPRIRTTDSLGICFGASSSTLLQKFICDQKGIEDCASVYKNPHMEVSQMGMVPWSNRNPCDPSKEECGMGGRSQDHKNIRFGGMGSAALRYFLKTKSALIPESCYPFDQFVNGQTDDNGKTVPPTLEFVEGIVSALKSLYERGRAPNQTEAGLCSMCLEILDIAQTKLKTKTEINAISTGLKSKTFDEFLYSLFFGSCDDKEKIKLRNRPLVHVFPEGSKQLDAKGMVAQIKEVLMSAEKAPINVDGLCLSYDKKGDCEEGKGHSVVIAGYRKYCEKKKKNGKEVCRELLKVHNSWGQDWQDRNNDGWVDAEALFGSKKYPAGALAWLTPKP